MIIPTKISFLWNWNWSDIGLTAKQNHKLYEAKLFYSEVDEVEQF
jgi:hypothetical protein